MIPKPKSYDWRINTKPENSSRRSNSRTIPDMNYSIREILDKFTHGQPINGMVSYNDYDGEYLNHHTEKPDFDGFMPHPKTLDLVDRQLMADRAREEIKNIEGRKKQRDTEIQREKSAQQKIIDSLTEKINQLEKPELPKA